MGPGEMLDEVGAGIVEHEDLAAALRRIVRPDDADHLGPSLMPTDMIEERLLAGAESLGRSCRLRRLGGGRGRRRTGGSVCGGRTARSARSQGSRGSFGSFRDGPSGVCKPAGWGSSRR